MCMIATSVSSFIGVLDLYFYRIVSYYVVFHLFYYAILAALLSWWSAILVTVCYASSFYKCSVNIHLSVTLEVGLD